MMRQLLNARPNRRQILKGAAATAALWASRSVALKAEAANLSATAGNQPFPAGTIAQIPMTIGSTPVGKVGSAFVGLAYPKEKILGTLFTGWDISLVSTFKLLGPSVLRVGGNSTDASIWTPNGSGGRQGQVAPTDVDNLAAFLQTTGWKCIYGINLGAAATGATSPTLAAEEATYVGKTLGTSLLSVELGNEPDLYGNAGNPYADADWSLPKFLTLWQEYRDAIVHAAPGIGVSGPADAGNPTTWTIPFGQAVTSHQINLLTEHYYVCGATSTKATVDNLLEWSLHHDLVTELAELRAASQSIRIPFRMNECGDFYSSSQTPQDPNVEGSYTAALWSLDYMFACAQAGAQGVNFEGGGSVSSYTPILNDTDYVCGIAPLFYGLKLFTMAGTGTGFQATLSPGEMNITGYALHRTGGGFSVVVVNKNATGSAQMQIEFPNNIVSATLTEMTQRSPGATTADAMATSGVTIQGEEISTSGAFSPAPPYQLAPAGNIVTCYVPPLSAVLISADD